MVQWFVFEFVHSELCIL